jgi:hypothetical protein
MLHVLNGDATAVVFAETGLGGERLVWRDILVEGPVGDGAATPPSLAGRAAYLAALLGIDAQEYVRGVEAQTARLAAAPEHEEIVLWFEQDLFCTVILWSLLAWMGRHRPAASLSLVYPALDDDPSGLGAVPAARLVELFAERQPATQRTRALGIRAWSAYASPDPFESAPLIEHESPALPFVRGAFRCHLGRFPSVANGLNELETATLTALRGGPRPFRELFREVTALPHLRRHGLGDLQFAACLRGLMPLVDILGATVLTAEIDITPRGCEVEAGELDWLALHEIDTWLGGVHLRSGGPIWRWDGARGRLVAPPQ